MMKMKNLYMAVLLIMVLNLIFSADTAAQDTHLSEVPEGFIGIYTATDLDNIRKNMRGKYILMNDIDLKEATSENGDFFNDGKGWEPIGDVNDHFGGTLDGNGYVISGLTIDYASEEDYVYVGLFGHTYFSVFKNITLEDASIKVARIHESYDSNIYNTGVNIGGVAGSLQDGQLLNSSFRGSIHFSNIYGYTFEHASHTAHVGGLVGHVASSEILNSSNYGSITGESKNQDATSKNSGSDFVGGIAGYLQESEASNVHNYGDLDISSKPSETGGRAYVGGVTGSAQSSIISNGSNDANVLAEANYMGHAGGIAGEANQLVSSLPSMIKNSTNSGVIRSNPDSNSYINYAGGIVGRSEDSSLMELKNSGSVLGNYAGGIAGSSSGKNDVHTMELNENSGDIEGEDRAGGIAGSAANISLKHSSNTGSVKGTVGSTAEAGGIVGELYLASVSESENKGGINGQIAGGIAGDVSVKGSQLINNTNAGFVTGDIAGGIAGQSDEAIISLSNNTGEIKSPFEHGSAGGVLGSDRLRSLILKSSNTANVTGGYAGGIAGTLANTSIFDAYNIGNISSRQMAGGIAGHGEGNFSIKRTYHAGSLANDPSSEKPIGGIIGGEITNSSFIESSYYLDSAVSAASSTALNGSGLSLTWSEMKNETSYSGFDFQNVWEKNSLNFLFPVLKGMAVNQEEVVLNSLIKTQPSKMIYKEGEPFETAGAILSLRTSAGNESDVAVTLDMISGYDGKQTGKQVVSINYLGFTNLIEVSVLKEYTVIFKDFDGDIIKTEKVAEGASATPPEEPTREGYIFLGWYGDFVNITGDSIVEAQYIEKEFNITFVDKDDNILREEMVKYGHSANPPNAPVHEGYTFIGWDQNYSFIEADLVVKASFEINKHTVTFLNFDGSVADIQFVEYGSPATTQIVPERRGYKFIGWDQDATEVKEDMTISALYEIIIAEETDRLFGSARYSTAVAISQKGWPTSKAVVLSTGLDFPDALAGGPLAYKENAPILLTKPATLHPETKKEIIRLGAEKVIILGGKGAVTVEVEEELRGMGLVIDRIGGKNRFDTAFLIAKRLPSERAVIANGFNFPDALSVSPYAAKNGIPILLTKADDIPTETANALIGKKQTIVVGSIGVISNKVMSQLLMPVRHGGKNRYETGKEIILNLPMGMEKAYVATGKDFPDALAGSVLAAKYNAPILLVSGTSIPETTEELITPYAAFTILGSKGAVSDDVKSILDEQLNSKR